MSTLTQRQQAIYEFIVRQIRRQGMPPTLMEIAHAFGLSSPAGVSDHLNAIERKGFIRRRRGVSRGIELAHYAGRRQRSTAVPVLGGVPAERGLGRKAAGPLLYLDARAVPGNALALRAAVALPEHGILEHDYLLIEPGANLRPGDLVVGRQGERSVLLRIGPRRRVHPLAGTPERGRPLELIGKVVGVFRTANGFSG